MIISLILFLFFPFVAFAAEDYYHRVIVNTALDRMEASVSGSPAKSSTDAEFSSLEADAMRNSVSRDDQSFLSAAPDSTAGSPLQSYRSRSSEIEDSGQAASIVSGSPWSDLRTTLAARFGYMHGMTEYDFDHHVSELEYPIDNWMIGGSASIGFQRLSISGQVLTNVDQHVGRKMRDRDWTDGNLVSYTKSDAYMNALLWDVGLRFDVVDRVIDSGVDFFTLKPGDRLTIGILGGYAQQRFDYDMRTLEYVPGPTLYEGEQVLTYKIRYNIPYIGLGVDAENKNIGAALSLKYGLHPTAGDVDGHVLRGLTFYGDYDRNAQVWMGSASGFWKFTEALRLKLGVDASVMRIDGITWEESHDPGWDKDQNTDAYHVLFWTELAYKF